MAIKVKPMKLSEILDLDTTNEDKQYHLSVCKNNVERELIELKNEIVKKNKQLMGLYKESTANFSASKIYNMRKEIDLLERKEEGIQKMLTELF